MAVTFVDYAIGESESTTCTVAKPTGTAEGDLMIAMHVHASSSVPDLSPPSGWTEIESQLDVGASVYAAYYKLAGASEPSSYDFTTGTTNGNAVAVITVTGVDQTTPVDAADLAGATGTSVSPSVTTTGSDYFLVAIAGHDRITSDTWSNAQGMTEEFDDQGLTSDDIGIAGYTQQVTTATAYSRTFTKAGSSDAIAAVLVAVVPASEGPVDGDVTAVAAEATAAAEAPSIAAGATTTGVAATASAEAVPPAFSAAATVNAVTATATSLALPPVVDGGDSPNGLVSAVAAEATALALPPVATGDAQTASVAATGTALALPPTVDVSEPVTNGEVLAVVAEATAEAVAPVAQGDALVTHWRARAFARPTPPTVFGQQSPTVEAVKAHAVAFCRRARVEVTYPTFRFEPPTHEAPMRTKERIHQFFRITHAASVVRVNGVLTTIHQPRPDQIAAAGEEGVDYFLGGRVYQVSVATKAELLAAGFDVE